MEKMIHGLSVRDTEPEGFEYSFILVRDLHSPGTLICFSELNGTVARPSRRIQGEFLPGDQHIPVKPAVKDERLSEDRVKGGETKNFPLADGKDSPRVARASFLQAGAQSGLNKGWLFGNRSSRRRRHLLRERVANEQN
jgi:hypothetical protein